jgi:hypothetical protein
MEGLRPSTLAWPRHAKAAGKPGGSQKSSIGRVLEQDGGDDQDLAGKGDKARRAGFDDTHFNFLLSGSRFAPVLLMSALGRYSQLQR